MIRSVILGIALAALVIGAPAQTDNVHRQSMCYPECWQCNPGECVKTHTADIPNSGYVHIDNPPCAGFTPEEVRLAVHGIAAYVSGGQTLGDPDRIDAEINRWRSILVRTGFGGSIEALLKGMTGANQSACVTLAVELPSDARVTRVLTGLQVGGVGAECPVPTNDLKAYNPSFSGDRGCPQGWSMYTQPQSDGRIWWTIAKNWSHNRSGRANFRVFYRR